MEDEAPPEYSITIEYDDFITRHDLDDILSSIDRIIEEEILWRYDDDFAFRRRRYSFPYRHEGEPELSYIGITGVDQGSMVLTAFISGAVAMYVAHRFRMGVDKSLLAEQIERTGRLAGDVLGRLLERVNDWAERYVPKQRELGG